MKKVFSTVAAAAVTANTVPRHSLRWLMLGSMNSQLDKLFLIEKLALATAI